VAGTVEVAMKVPKQISTGLARMSAMLAKKTTPDQATMHVAQRVPDHPYMVRQLSGGETWTDL
jgi:hypothetical protein